MGPGFGLIALTCLNKDDFDDIGILLAENAHRFKALQHRYCGKSIPFGSRNEAFKNASTLGYFNSAQALADYAEIVIHIKEKFHAPCSPENSQSCHDTIKKSRTVIDKIDSEPDCITILSKKFETCK
uniref:Uncharacterized protein n=1 Tax=Salix viminalis TaxID=40686 RepID=A0A6N2KXJ6_SALVM